MGSKEQYRWVVTDGAYYQDGINVFACKTKKVAVQKCRNDGFKHSSKYDLWSNDGTGHWRTLEKLEYLK